MGIKANQNGNIDATFKLFLQEVERQLIESLCRVGEEAVTIARNEHANNWTDRTSNLRSSIGYVVFKNGEAVMQSTFEQLPPKDQKEAADMQGGKTGESLAKQIGAETQGYSLVVVAGMNYAVHVEAKGYDVLTSAERTAESRIAQELADLVTNVKEAFS